MKSGRFVIGSLLPDVSKIWSFSGVILEEFFLMIFMEYVPLCLRIVQKQIVYCAVEHNSLLFKNGCVFRPYATIISSLTACGEFTCISFHRTLKYYVIGPLVVLHDRNMAVFRRVRKIAKRDY